MNERERIAIVRELKVILESLCSRELSAGGREFIKKRIKYHENRISQVRAK